MDVELYNTLTRKKELFVPLSDEQVRMYACGPTVYNYAHLGNLRAYVFMDLLHRTLQYAGYSVNLVVNITDVGHLTDDADAGEDKMEKGAAREGKSVWDIAQFYTQAFYDDITALNIKQPTTWCKATDHIEQQIALVQAIEKNGFAYTTDDGVYFDTSKLADYGKLIPNFNPEALQGGKRVDLGGKKNKTDFALWKFSPKDEQRAMEWDSPWGKGFPGWHIECTAMGCHYLGEQFDIHTGGIDHIPIHHTNEIAQAQGAFGNDHVRVWMHNEFLLTDKEKMAKSSGNFLRMQTLVDKGFHPLDYRYFLLQTHYRKAVTFSWQALDAAKTARERLMKRIVVLKQESDGVVDMSDVYKDFASRFAFYVSDDLDVPGALALLHDLLKSDVSSAEKLSLALNWDQVFGLQLKAATEQEAVPVPDAVQSLVDAREHARAKKDWSKADRLRDEIEKKGWSISDSADGPALSPL